MPNYCFNKVTASKEVLESLYEGKRVTFEKLIPMPKKLNLTESSIIEDAVVYAMSKKEPEDFLKIKKAFENKKEYFYENYWEKIKKEFSIDKMKQIEVAAKRFIPDEETKKFKIKTLEELGNAYINNYLNYGSFTWYDWSCDNWGTKWDACESKGTPESGELKFYTAWSEPRKVIEALLKKFPNEEIEWEYEEECNEFSGRIYADGKGNVKEEKQEREETDEEEEEVEE